MNRESRQEDPNTISDTPNTEKQEQSYRKRAKFENIKRCANKWD